MSPWFALAAIPLAIAVLALAWALQLHRKLGRVTLMYNELFSTQVRDPLIAWTEARETDPAEIRISWSKAGTAAYRVVLENVGKAPAHQLHFNLMSSNGYCPLEPEVMGRLFPVTLGIGEEYKLFALPSRWMSDPFHATVIWQDAHGSRYNLNIELYYET